jgi:hypothetical protein
LPRCNPPEQLKSQLAQRRWYCPSRWSEIRVRQSNGRLPASMCAEPGPEGRLMAHAVTARPGRSSRR